MHFGYSYTPFREKGFKSIQITEVGNKPPNNPPLCLDCSAGPKPALAGSSWCGNSPPPLYLDPLKPTSAPPDH